VIVLGAILLLIGGGPFNPGPLTDIRPRGIPLAGFVSHAAFEQQCDRCHVPWQLPSAARCEQCHEDIARQRSSKAGLHGLLVDAERCVMCHDDHLGRNATITAVSPQEFDHTKVTGFSLAHHDRDYAGKPLACEGCHLEHSYALDKVDCVNCHMSGDVTFTAEHVNQFGENCPKCHDGVDRMAQFDHAQVFPLEGAHAQVDCGGCHAGQEFKDTARTCRDCHAEPAIHAGKFGLDCVRCHTVQAWAPAQLTRHTFPLDHGGLGPDNCQTCHLQTYAQYNCYGCHEHEPKEIAREHLDEGIVDFAPCADCHATGHKDK
jgi:hypothetical protein